jgi:hypothetical protein
VAAGAGGNDGRGGDAVNAKAGIHFPNGGFANTLACIVLGWLHFVYLHEQACWALAMRMASPLGTILCRFYLPNWRQRDPRDWARECARWYLMPITCPVTGRTFTLKELKIAVTPANEMNLAIEGGDDSRECYLAMNWWLLEWHDEFVRLTGISNELTHWPATAAGHSDDQDDKGYIGDELCRPSIERYGVKDVHVYWDEGTVLDLYETGQGFRRRDRKLELYGRQIGGGWRFQLTHERFPHKRLFISESGQFNVLAESAPAEFVAWFDSLALPEFDYLDGATPFIWADPTHAHMNNDWSRNPKIAEVVASYLRQERTVLELGPGFKRAIAAGLLPGFGENEIWHLAGTQDETSLAVGRDGFATWRRDTNEVVVVRDDGAVFADNGNRGDGQFRRLR